MGERMDMEQFFEDGPDIDAMDREELRDCLRRLRERIAELDEREPADMNSEEYEAWGQLHEEAEDLADEVRDRLDELE